MSFSDLGLKPELLRAVSEKGYDVPTPIQMQAIPAVLEGRDVLAGAQTGTGKTAAFVLPMLQRLGQPTGRVPRALVLTPTRELAAQVAENARGYGKYVGLRTAVVFGGVSINPQIDTLRAGCDLLIATPGRLLDLAEQRALDLSGVQCFVLDEADRMLDMGFIHAIRRVLKMLPPQRQNLMFSATYSEDIRGLASRFLRSPVTIEVAARNATADRVSHEIYRVPRAQKRHLLAHLINDGNWFQVLVFTRTKHGANRLAQQLESSGIRSSAIHGNKSQAARVRALADFKANKITALVATEVAARGLDIKELPHVVNYELPNVPEDYVHRIGRTARAGATGSAVSLVSPEEGPLLRDIERMLKRSLPVAALPDFRLVSESATGYREAENDDFDDMGGFEADGGDTDGVAADSGEVARNGGSREGDRTSGSSERHHRGALRHGAGRRNGSRQPSRGGYHHDGHQQGGQRGGPRGVVRAHRVNDTNNGQQQGAESDFRGADAPREVGGHQRSDGPPGMNDSSGTGGQHRSDSPRSAGGQRRGGGHYGSGGSRSARGPNGSGGSRSALGPNGSGGSRSARGPNGSGDSRSGRGPNGSGGSRSAGGPNGSGGPRGAGGPRGPGGQRSSGGQRNSGFGADGQRSGGSGSFGRGRPGGQGARGFSSGNAQQGHREGGGRSGERR